MNERPSVEANAVMSTTGVNELMQVSTLEVTNGDGEGRGFGHEDEVIHYDIPSPSQTFVIHTSLLNEETEGQQETLDGTNEASTEAPTTIFYLQQD